MCAGLGAGGPGQRLLQLTQTLNVCLLKTHVFLEIGRALTSPGMQVPDDKDWWNNQSVSISVL